MNINEVQRIFHPTDFSRGSEAAFAHALKLSLAARAELEIFHVDRHPELIPWSAFPSVRETLIRWGVLPAHASEADVAKLGISVHKSIAGGGDPLHPILDHLELRPADLIVLASHHPSGVDRWMHKHIAQHVARLARKPALFVPYGSSGFVNAESGRLTLDRILIPFDVEPMPLPAIDAVLQLTTLLQAGPASCDLLHVGTDGASLPALQLPELPHLHWESFYMQGEVAGTILDFAAERQATLIALTTQGHHGFLDLLRSNTTDRLLATAPCPTLAIPYV
ncbi:MAG: universal stress protein [Planctomycetia bacterium]|nr:universal stress protein [Planctomycetia bacterium]